MSLQQIDVDTRETVAGVVRLLRRAAELIWLVLEIDGVGSPRQVLASGIDVAVDEARNLLPDATSIEGLCRSGMNQPISSNRLRTLCVTSCGKQTPCRRLISARSASCWPTATHRPARRSSTQHSMTRRWG
jgi:hypothetical protein